jgi:hypothetical protein
VEMYLASDVIGPYSRIQYGQKGDKVTVINSETEMILVETNGERFYTKLENLSDKPVPVKAAQDPLDEIVNPVVTKQYFKQKAKPKQVQPPHQNQTQLF